MRIKIIGILVLFICIVNSSYSQNKSVEHNLSTYISNITKGIEPTGTSIITKYDKEYRLISFRDALIKKYKYSDEELNKLGFEMNHNNKNEFILCSKNIILTREKSQNTCLIQISWYDDKVKNSTELMLCR